MHFLSSGSPWATAMVTALLATTVCSVPVHLSGTSTSVERASEIQPRDPRIIPETEHYLDDILNMLTGETDAPEPTTTKGPVNGPMKTSTPSSAAKAEQSEPANTQAPSKTQTHRPLPSQTTSAETVSFTTTVKSESRPIQNVQIGAGWKGKNRIEASDVPVIMNAVYQDIADRFNDMIDSSDEVGL